jgi:hypothetical protein
MDAMSLPDCSLRSASEVVSAVEGGLAYLFSRRLNPVLDRMTLNDL